MRKVYNEFELTFVLTLKGRANYSESWIKNNLRPGYRFYVADGSSDDLNKQIFEKNIHKNLVYKFYGEDRTVKDYLNKIVASILAVKTEYVMLCDNDDFINYTGIKECIKILDNNRDFTCAGGNISSVFKSRSSNHLYNLPVPFFSTKSIHNISKPFEAFKEIRKDYKYLWYAVYRKNDLLKIWKQIVELDIHDLFFVEILQVDLALRYGRYFNIEYNHYIRLMNTNGSGAQSFGEFYHKKIFFDTSYRDQLYKINQFYADLYNKNLSEIEKQQENFYLWYFKQAPRIKSALLRKIHGAIIRLPFFQIQNCISILNAYLKIKILFKTFFK